MDQKPRRPRIRSIDGFIQPSNIKKQSTKFTPQVISRPKPVSTAKPTAKLDQTNFTTYYTPSGRSVTPIKRSKPKVPWSRKRKVLTSFLILFILVGSISAYFGVQVLGNLNKVFHGNFFSDVGALFGSTKLKGEDTGRVNILLAGNSVDDPNHGGAQLTDSIMVASIDTKNHTGFLLSIPRDLWVNTGSSHQKINAAYENSSFNQSGYPKGGMGQLENIVQNQLGIPIDYYSLVDYTAFKDAVNAVGGITVNIQSDDPRGLYDPNIAKADGGPLKLPSGPVTLNGQTALNLARARGDPCFCGHYEYGFAQSDFNRTQHQRQELSALVIKAQSAGVLANPIKVTNLFKAFGNNVQTDLSLQEVLRFVQITKGLNINNLQSLTYSNSGKNQLLQGYSASDGEAALIPKAGLDNFSQMQQYYKQLTSNNPAVREAPTVVILNGTGINGLAKKEAAILSSQGYAVIGTADANSLYTNTLIVDLTQGKKPASKSLLQTLFSRNSSVTSSLSSSSQASEAQNYIADFVVIVGKNTNNTQQP